MAFRERCPIARLPQELVDETVAHFQDDVASLSACAHIGYAWLSSSRAHLFRDVRLHPGDYDKPAETLGVMAKAIGRRTFVKSLTLSVVKRQTTASVDIQQVDIDPSFLASVLRYTPCVRTISFDRCLLLTSSVHTPALHSTLKSLQLLAISPPTTYDFRISLAQTLAFFQYTPTNRLEIHAYSFREIKYESTSLLKLGTAWKLGPPFSLRPAEADALCRWVVETVIVSGIWLLMGIKESLKPMLEGPRRVALCVGRLTAIGSPVLDDFWREVGPKITDLELEVEYKLDVPGIDVSRRWRNFRHCRALRSLTFPVSPYSTLATGYRNVLEALANGPVSMEQVILELQVRRDRDVSVANQLRVWDDRMDWTLLENTLTHFRDVKMLKFIVRHTAGEMYKNMDLFRTKVESLVALRLPGLHHAGKTCVEIGSTRL
ncbi:hypothetical protein PHLGIDRAFT_224647 [Phlebiopsis gigantea 11061_1 CR5-6]|uniref:F-box domain-containing protein n=1 Tax=Phlebiopsis gigantea (strain 11061_1 CR5-6) TaxID=745531 RepID=A0A0C3S5Y5_PHLG1|nr:hypothetical protein PHLGIDRAFT_224647 [Phlebiopsis gigantea 11061_1 CR5-6]